MKELSSIFTAEGDISKRWYISFYCNDPITSDRVRFREYGQVNRIKDPALRLQKLLEIKSEIDEKLWSGWTPFREKKSLFPGKVITLREAIQIVLQYKKTYQRPRSYSSTQSHLNVFLKYCEMNKMDTWPVFAFRRNHINSFFQHKLVGGISIRTRNNYLIDIHSFFKELKKEMIIDKNPCEEINHMRTSASTHVSYSEEELHKVIDWLKKYDQYMLLFSKFIIYEFMRPKEIRLLQVKHIDIKNWEILVPAENEKTGRTRKKLIQDIFKKEILSLNFSQYDPEFYVFTANRCPGRVPMGVNYFTKRFKILKRFHGFTDKHTMYGLRHTYVCQLIRNGADRLDIMKLTGHTTFHAFEKYMRDIFAEPPKDLSSLYSVIM